MEEIKKVSYIEDIKEILRNSKNKIYNSVNSIMLESYWKIGKRIIEEIERKKLMIEEEIIKYKIEEKK